MKYYVGLDVSSKTTCICILDEEGKIVNEGIVKTDPSIIARYLFKNKFEDIIIGFESGSLSHYFITGFAEKGLNAVCMDARKLQPILAIKINKTDKNDARGIADALRTNMYTRVHFKPQESVEQGIFLVARRTLINQQKNLKNTIRGLLKTYGINLGSVSAKKFSEVIKKHIEFRSKIVITSLSLRVK